MYLECCCGDRLLLPEIFKFHIVDVKTLVGKCAPASEWNPNAWFKVNVGSFVILNDGSSMEFCPKLIDIRMQWCEFGRLHF